jgi:hypothetical protein
VVYAALFHDGVGDVVGFNFSVYREIPPGKRTVPNIMIAFAASDKIAAVF